MAIAIAFTGPGAKAQTTPSSFAISPQYPQIATGQTQQFSVLSGNAIPAQGVTAVAAGNDFACALLANGTVECWGGDSLGELGDNDAGGGYSNTPVAVSGLAGVTAIAAGDFFACALLSGGTVDCWGVNTSGQLGSGTSLDVAETPVAVSGLSGVVAIATGTAQVCALLSNGTVECWGANNSGQLGNGTTTSSSTPVAVIGLSGTVAIAAGTDNVCALLSDGAVKCWGDNAEGQLGTGTAAVESSTPVAIIGLSGAAVAITSGYDFNCAVLLGGSVECWGANNNGQLGNGTTNVLGDGVSTPVAVSGLSGAVAITAGFDYTCAVLSGGIVECWATTRRASLGTAARPTLTPRWR